MAPTSRAIAFEGLLNSGENFAARLKAGFKDTRSRSLAALRRMASRTGITISHGEMALAYAVRLSGAGQDRQADKLRQLSGAVSARVGVRDCRRHLMELRTWRGALALQLRVQRRQTGMEPEMAEAPARGSRRIARCDCASDGAGRRQSCLRDVWAARDAYIDVILDRSEET